MQTLPLSQNWQFKQRNPNIDLEADFSSGEWLPAIVPGTVHTDLMTAGRIPDPFYGLNELDVQWVGEADWLYATMLDVTPEILAAPNLDLCFDGLDTFATVWLNGEKILECDNMFLPQRVSVKEHLGIGKNELRIQFESCVRHGEEREKENEGFGAVWNSVKSRIYVRKMQCQYGWDWGPVLITCGLWRPARLEAYSTRIADLACPSEVSQDLKSATINAKITLSPSQDNGLGERGKIRFTLIAPNGEKLAETEVAETIHTFSIQNPMLWYPRTHGAQPLYHVEATLLDGNIILDETSRRIGLRRARLVQEPLVDEPGTTFYFEINNKPVFSGGTNWIPADNFIPRIGAEKYRKWIELAAEGNQNMLRVWGGGIYEEDIFYDLCDEMGLMVWQDFMFGCALYPTPAWLLDSVRAEAEANVRRLRNHPSLVLWCGNNEDYTFAKGAGIWEPKFEGNFSLTKFPAREIYERVLPSVCAELDPTRPYWRGSPYNYSPELGMDEVHQGDRHVWEIWHGQLSPYQTYPNFKSRFTSEFGMQAAPDMRMLNKAIPPEERKPNSRFFEHHNKMSDGPRRLAVYINDNIPFPQGLEDYIYATQFIQAESNTYGINGWRRRFSGPGRYYSAGAIIWQLNDCWPVTSWAIADYEARPKAAFYAVKRALAPLSIGLAKSPQGKIEVWAGNSGEGVSRVSLELSAITFSGEEIARETKLIFLAGHQSSELGVFEFTASTPVVVTAKLTAAGHVARNALWPVPFKFYPLPDPGLQITREGDTLTLQVERPAKGVWLDAGDGVMWSDNFLDLVPGDQQTITARGLGERPVSSRWLKIA
jgi:beta-mannosidase